MSAFPCALFACCDPYVVLILQPQVGTTSHMAPEVISGWSYFEGSLNLLGCPRAKRVPRAADIWSLGCLLYCIVYGR